MSSLRLVLIGLIGTILLDVVFFIHPYPFLSKWIGELPSLAILGIYSVVVIVFSFRMLWEKGKEVEEPMIGVFSVIAHLGFLVLSGSLVIVHALVFSGVLGWGGSLAGMVFIAYPGLILFILYYLVLGFIYNRLRKGS